MLALDLLEDDRGVTLRVVLLFASSGGLTRGVTGVLLELVGSRGAGGLEGVVDVALPATRGVKSGVLAVLADASVGFSGRFVVRSEDMAGVTSAVAAALIGMPCGYGGGVVGLRVCTAAAPRY